MKNIVIFHNPGAGDSDHRAEELRAMMEAQGFSTQYKSVKAEGWQDFDENADLLVCAGGDGCVRKVIGMLLNRSVLEKQFPLTIIPLGTANNIAKTLRIKQDTSEAIQAIHSLVPQRLDIGMIKGFGDDRVSFFVEGIGMGVFPALMKEMKNISMEAGSVEAKLEETLRVMEELVEAFTPLKAAVAVNGEIFEGEYLMLEVMNTKFVGPNLLLAGSADPGDGRLELVLIPVEHRRRLMQHIRASLNGIKDDFTYPRIKANEFSIVVPETDFHVDDQAVRFPGGELRIYLKEGVLEMLVPTPANQESF